MIRSLSIPFILLFFIRFIGKHSFKRSFYVQVEDTHGSRDVITFVKPTTAKKKKKILCNMPIVPLSNLQVFNLLLRWLGDNDTVIG